MDQSKILWAEVTGGSRAKEQAIIQIEKKKEASKEMGSSNRSKTDPISLKFKA
jgi:hypothetical protein